MSQLAELILRQIPNIEQHSWIMWLYLALIIGGWAYFIYIGSRMFLNKKNNKSKRIGGLIMSGGAIYLFIYLFFLQN